MITYTVQNQKSEGKIKKDQSKHGPLKKIEVGLERASSAERSHPPCTRCRNRENEKKNP